MIPYYFLNGPETRSKEVFGDLKGLTIFIPLSITRGYIEVVPLSSTVSDWCTNLLSLKTGVLETPTPHRPPISNSN